MALILGGGKAGGGTQSFVRVTLRHSADFSNLSGGAPVLASTASRVAAAFTLPPSLFGNDSIIDVRVANDNASGVLVGGSLVVQNSAGTVWIEQDTSSDQTVAAGATASINFSANGGSAGAGLSWDGTNKQVAIALSGVYSAFATLTVLPA